MFRNFVLAIGVLLAVHFCEVLNCMQLNILKVGQANCTIFKAGDKALIYDCGSMNGAWVRDSRFVPERSAMFKNLLMGINEVGVVISHDDEDHKNLLPAVKMFWHAHSGKEIAFEIFEKKGTAVSPRDLAALQGFFLDDMQRGFECFLFIPEFTTGTVRTSKNDSSAILKVVDKNSGFAFLMTGDATDKTLQAIQGGKFLVYGGDANQDLLRNEGRHLFENVVCFMPAHHGSATDGSFEWSRKVLGESRFPVLTVISSDPKSSSHSPSFNTISELSGLSFVNLAHFPVFRYYCVPHVVDCYWSNVVNETQGYVDLSQKISAIMKYPPIRDHYILPIFVTSNTWHLFSVSLNNGIIQLNDNGCLLYECDLFSNEDYKFLSDACLYLAYGRLIKELRDIVNYRLMYCAGWAEQQYWNDVQRKLGLIVGYETDDDTLRVLENDHRMAGISNWLQALVAELKREYGIPARTTHPIPMEE